MVGGDEVVGSVGVVVKEIRKSGRVYGLYGIQLLG